MSSLPPPGSRSTPSLARKNKSAASPRFGEALKAGAQQVEQEQTKPSRGKKSPQIRIAKQTYGNLLATKLLKALGWILFFALIVYVSFAVTIMRFIPSTTMGMIPEKNITYSGGLLPSGALVVVDTEGPVGSSMTDYLKQAFIPTSSAAVVRAEAGPWGTFDWNEGQVTVDEKLLEMTMPEAPETDTLESQYLVTCVAGACTPGQGYIIDSNQVMGQYLGSLGAEQ